MLMPIFLLIVLALVGVAALPLMLGVVPPNPYYGWPTGSGSKKVWMRVNQFAGRAVLAAVVVAGAGLWIYNGTLLRSALLQLVFVIVVLAIAVATIVLYVRRIDR